MFTGLNFGSGGFGRREGWGGLGVFWTNTNTNTTSTTAQQGLGSWFGLTSVVILGTLETPQRQISKIGGLVLSCNI
jgi:hypothetical protein